ncbi:hypothetical protein HELRODRAFT_172823 [Helobdella robusta]|uniref:Uncharacterized protein n=1 Tax=Helobdella robusta TaxID=6412 RepID=T1F5Z2_HELRO|nr:hypothetical protein HELRODRAFT_172823 [Helobdella robusta]ESO04431.1 hypothetical protein HELRODRAFT_172823 [Helobdella robusta]
MVINVSSSLPYFRNYFLYQDKCRKFFKDKYESDFTIFYLKFVQYFIQVFHQTNASLEEEENSIFKVINLLSNLKEMLENRIDSQFLSLDIKNGLEKLNNDYEGFEKESEHFKRHNASTERVFSLLESQWADERNHLKLLTVESLAIINYNYKIVSCNRWVLRSALNFASDGEVVREVGREFQRKKPEKAKVASAREQDMEIYEKRKGHEQLDEQQS